MVQCCCGKLNFDSVESMPIQLNDTIHEPLGPKGNFCGPSKSHLIRDLEKENYSLKTKLDRAHQAQKIIEDKLIDTRNDYMRVRELTSTAICRLSKEKYENKKLRAKYEKLQTWKELMEEKLGQLE